MKKEKLKKILNSDDVIKSIKNNLDELLKAIPEIKDMIGFKHKNPAHHLDVWNHTLLALYKSPNNFKIRLVLLLHDIGKPHSYQDLEVRHFKGHEEKSYQMSLDILKRLNFDKKFIEETSYLIRYHDTPISDELINTNIELAQELFIIQYCDAMAHNPEKLEKRKQYLIELLNKINDDCELVEYQKKLRC